LTVAASPCTMRPMAPPTLRSTDRILTTHVGSLVRPDDFVTAMQERRAGGGPDDAAFDELLARSVHDVVRRQGEVGIDLVSDGEFGKTISWSRYILERLAGFEDRTDASGKDPKRPLGNRTDIEQFPEFYAEYNSTQGFEDVMRNPVCVAPITYAGQAALQRDIANVLAAVDAARAAGHEVSAFLPVVAPASVAYARHDEYYASEEDYVFAVASALREEYTAVIDAGLMLQIDDAHLPMMYDNIVDPGTPDDFRRWARLRIDALNHALEGIPVERTRYHICWGSFNSPHTGDVPFAEIADLVLSVNVGGYAIEMANPRHEHEWRVWEHIALPDDKVLIPGVIAHTTNVVEHPELVAERLVRLAKLVGRERVIGGTDCGFAQGPYVRRVHPTIMWAKLDALVQGARLATAELW
jgi:5-methyltetrahydropteroyltriglutamate--homocysteine methyltransferase